MLTGELVNTIRTNPGDNPALQDVRDLHVKLTTVYDQIQEDVNNLLNAYISLSAQKTSEVMKVLTIFSVFFYATYFYRWHIWDELRFYARAAFEMGISGSIDRNVYCNYLHLSVV